MNAVRNRGGGSVRDMPDAYDDVPHYGVRVNRALAAMKEGRYADAAKGLEWAAAAAFGAGDTMEAKIAGNNAVTAFAKAGDSAGALGIATHMVDLFRDANLAGDIPGFARHALESLRLSGFVAAADALSVHVKGVMGAAWSDPAAPTLAALCPSCGAAVKPSEVVRPTPSTVACRYCGASVDAR
jgi:hypothetical protein